MFNFFKSNKKYEPLDYETRKFFEHNLLWLIQEFPEPKIEDRKILLPTDEDFPIKWNNSKENVNDAFTIICENMQVDSSEIEITFFDNADKEINMGSSVIFMESDPEDPEHAGVFHHEKVNGKYQISIDRALLKQPDALIATLAHELAHVKLLVEKQLEVNDELLTDFTTVFFGCGIFCANAAFQYFQEVDRWGYNNFGYLKVDEWGYALALFAFKRNESSPEWKRHLSKSVEKEFEKSLEYMRNNRSDIFVFEDEG